MPPIRSLSFLSLHTWKISNIAPNKITKESNVNKMTYYQHCYIIWLTLAPMDNLSEQTFFVSETYLALSMLYISAQFLISDTKKPRGVPVLFLFVVFQISIYWPVPLRRNLGIRVRHSVHSRKYIFWVAANSSWCRQNPAKIQSVVVVVCKDHSDGQEVTTQVYTFCFTLFSYLSR